MSVNYIVELLILESYNTITIIIDRLIKMRHFVPITNKVIVEDITDLFINYVYKLYRFPDTVMSDWGPQFNTLF